MNARGFLGSNASVLSDLSLLFGIGVAILLTIGVVMARKRKFEVHRRIQGTAVCLNILQVALIMVGSFVRSAASGVPSRLGEPYYAVATVHGIAGALTVLFGTFVVLRANELVPSSLRFHNYKLFMRTAYGAYMTVTVLGVGLYLTWYTGAPAETQPVAATQANEVLVPMAGFNFDPGVMVVGVGSTVTWVNQDNAPHTATADDESVFKSDVLRNGQTFSFSFDAPGEFKYYCELHGSQGGEGMSGTIKVVTRRSTSGRGGRGGGCPGRTAHSCADYLRPRRANTAEGEPGGYPATARRRSGAARQAGLRGRSARSGRRTAASR